MRKTTKLIMVTSVLAAVGILVSALLFVLFKYDKAWYPGTSINGVDISGMSYEDSIDTINSQMNNYFLNISGRDNGKLTIKGVDIELKLESDRDIAILYNEQHEKFSFSRLLSKDSYEVDLNVVLDEEKLSSIISSSELVVGSDSYEVKQPVNAKVEYSDKEGRMVIIPEVEGNSIDESALVECVKEAAAELIPNIALEDDETCHDVYLKPEILSDNEGIVTAYRNYNTYLYQWITWDLGNGRYETISPDEIRQWITLKEDGTVSLDKEKMSEWIEEFCLRYKTMGMTRKFTTHDGREIEVVGGDYGWRIDYEKTVEAAYDQLTSEKEWGPVDNYIKASDDSNKEALTTHWEPTYSNTAFKMDFDNPGNDWDTKNYSEIDLAEQKVYVYKDGKLAHECICVTGLPSDPERKTRTGCYYVKEKKESYVLRGEDYTTPTKYWIRIMWSGTGYHYMNRRDWNSWDKDLYKRRGSHGCINLQYDDAQTIFGLIDFYDAVFIHE